MIAFIHIGFNVNNWHGKFPHLGNQRATFPASLKKVTASVPSSRLEVRFDAIQAEVFSPRA